MNRKYQKLFITIFILSLALRLGLTLVNREANDDHMEVVRLILTSHQLPSMVDCRECFHPKLFYVSAAALLQAFRINDANAQTVFIQFVNFLAGAITLTLVWKLIQDFPTKNDAIKLIAFALLALNPKWIAINAQASNDSFVILFCTAALFSAYRFLTNKANPTEPAPIGNLPASRFAGIQTRLSSQETFRAAQIVLLLLLAVSTKTTAWITFAAIFLAFLLAAWAEKSRTSAILLYLSILLVCVPGLTSLNPLSQFVTNYQQYGSPIVNSKPALPLPAFSKPTTSYKKYYFRPGIVSMQDGFLTFKFIDLLQHPLTTNEQFNYPPQRTSFWTMLYADIHSLHFQNWPKSWQTSGTDGFNLSRGLFILGLLPTFIFVAGFFLEIALVVKGLFKRDLRAAYNGLFLAVACGYILFLLLCALLFRDFSFIKLVYILPGLPAFIWLFLRGAESLLSHQRRLTWLFNGAIVALLALYVLDVTTLIIHLL